MNPQQLEAIRHDKGPLLIVAGAGTGKTTTLVEKIHYLIEEKKVAPDKILALTFTEKAAHEMEERIDEKLPYGFVQMWISTFHSFADHILRLELMHIGMNPNYRLMTEAETLSFLRAHLFAFELEYFRPLGNPNKFLSALYQHVSRLRDEDVTAEEYQDWVKSTKFENEEEQKQKEELANMYMLYQQLKVEEGVMDFGDLVYYLLKLFRTRPNILAQYRKQFPYLLVDEFQDTNIAQYNLIKLLAPPSTQLSNGHKTTSQLTVVGDDSQAIYKFRGASVSNILTFMKDYPDATQVSLTTNYRSNQTILDAAYRLIKHNDPDTLEHQLGISKELKAFDNSKPKSKIPAVQFNVTDRVEEEASYVIKEITQLQSSYKYGDMAILVRAHAHLDSFIRALQLAGIPYQLHGQSKLYRQQEVKDLIAYIFFLADPEDHVSLYRLLSMSITNIPPVDIALLISFAKKTGSTLFRALEIVVQSKNGEAPANEELANYKSYLPHLSEPGLKALSSLFKTFLKHFGMIKKNTAGQILFSFMEETGYLRILATPKSEKEERIVQNISNFFDRVKSYETAHDNATVYALADHLKLSLELGDSPNVMDTDLYPENAVHLTTVHSSKGLEFPVVFIVNLTVDRFPTRNRREPIPIPTELIKEVLPQGDFHLQEERRLFYVAMTRAKDWLYLTTSKYYNEGKRERKISPFIKEALGERVVESTVKKKMEATNQLSIFEFKLPQEVVITAPTKLPNSLFLSYTQLDTYKLCPLRYRYQYILKVPSTTHHSASFGTSIHQSLQLFYQHFKSDQTLGIDALLNYYKMSWIPIGYLSRSHENKVKKEGEAMLRAFYDKHHTKEVRILDLERLFRIKINDTVFLTGKIDRVDTHPDGSIEIIDYKTGNKPDEKEIQNTIQLSIYLMAAGEKGLYDKSPDQVTLTFYYLKDNSKVSLTKSASDVMKVRELVQEIVGQISDQKFAPKVGKWCDFCQYKMICDAWQ